MQRVLSTRYASRRALCALAGSTTHRRVAVSAAASRGARAAVGVRAVSTTAGPCAKAPVTDETRKVRGHEKRFGGAHGFPDWIEKWGRGPFYKLGYGATGVTALSAAYFGVFSAPTVLLGLPLAAYWFVGLRDMKQSEHALKRNFPVLANARYFLETIRPEIRQYLVESDTEAVPFSRLNRSVVYQRAKAMTDTTPFGTRRDVYEEGYEWINHSIFTEHVTDEDARVTIGGKGCKQPYSAALLNISAMSFGALSENAILALNAAAKQGNFYHNTGEGGVSEFHKRPGGDIVWNVGTGYFGCRADDGTFDEAKFKETASLPQIKMIELKLSQGAKPGHGGILPASKLTPAIAAARGVPMGRDCESPPRHSAFNDFEGMMEFVHRLRTLSGGKPVGIKFCVGMPAEVAGMVLAMRRTVDAGIPAPDFLTIDGGEGGTGAAPPEFSNHVGMPLVEGLTLVNLMLKEVGLRDELKLIASGKVVTGFNIVRNLALGADLCNSARGMMFALGCVQALKCNTNQCPTGVATQDPALSAGLVPERKSVRVARFQAKTVKNAREILGAAGLAGPSEVTPDMVMVRTNGNHVSTLDAMYYQGREEEVAALLKQAQRYLRS